MMNQSTRDSSIFIIAPSDQKELSFLSFHDLLSFIFPLSFPPFLNSLLSILSIPSRRERKKEKKEERNRREKRGKLKEIKRLIERKEVPKGILSLSCF